MGIGQGSTHLYEGWFGFSALALNRMRPVLRCDCVMQNGECAVVRLREYDTCSDVLQRSPDSRHRVGDA